MYITNCEKVSTLTFLLHTKCTHTTTRTQNQWTEQLFTVSENCAAISVKIQYYEYGYAILHARYSVLGTRCGISHFICCVCVCVIHPCITYYFLIIISSVYARLVRQWSEVATIEGYIQYIQIPKVYLCMWLRAEYHICVSTSPTHGNWATLRLTSLLLSSTYGHFHL